MPTATLPGPHDLADGNVKPVSSLNKWDPLEEVIVGRIDGAIIPPYHVGVTFNVPSFTARLHRFVASRRYPRRMIDLAQKERDAFVRILEAEGVTLCRPELGSTSSRTVLVGRLTIAGSWQCSSKFQSNPIN